MSTFDCVIDTNMRYEVIEGVLNKLRTNYVFPDVAKNIERSIRQRGAEGAYNGITTAQALCNALNADLQNFSRDRHLRISYIGKLEPELNSERNTGDSSSTDPSTHRRFGALYNFGFEKVERLAGNIGYLDLRMFFGDEMAGATAVAAMNFLLHTDALIIDLRHNNGGDPSMVAFISSYLFTVPVHLNNLLWQPGEQLQQFWTLPYVPGSHQRDKPVYILIGGNTFSGGEEFAYNLKNLNRAILIGETTAGAANAVSQYSIGEHFGMWIPVGRAVNPVTGTNWEGTGVIPDIEVPEEDALMVAHREALTKVLEKIGSIPDGPTQSLVEEVRTSLTELETRPCNSSDSR